MHWWEDFRIILITYFSTVVPLTSFLSCRPFVVNETFSTGLVVSSVNCPSQETEVSTRPVENFALTTKGLQEKQTQIVSETVVEK